MERGRGRREGGDGVWEGIVSWGGDGVWEGIVSWGGDGERWR